MASILVINDDPVQLHLLASWLEKDYFAVNRFVCSEEAWRWLQEGNVPDVIVLDLGLPDGQGLEMVVGLKKNFPNIPLFILTGVALGHDTTIQALNSGAADVFIKGAVGGHAIAGGIRDKL